MSYNLGAIVARRLRHNAGSGYFYGGIYATRLARELSFSPLPYDPILPTQYLDFDAMKHHKILKGDPHNFTYKLLLNKDPMVETYFPAPALFNVHNRGRYYVLESEARAHNAAVVAAWQAEAPARRFSVTYHSDHYIGYCPITKLGQNPKLGGVCISTDITFMITHFIPVVGVHTFSLYHPC